jgi:hypothetical protein
MACPHKFQADLNLSWIDFEPTTLIIGTFNPSWPAGNNATWFYGRTHDEYGNQNNNFWDVLPRLYGEPSLINSNTIQWKDFCRRNQIAITDIIASIEDADPRDLNHVGLLRSFSDDNIANQFYDFDLVNLVRILRNHPTITNVYVTRNITQAFWKHKLSAVKNYCLANGISIQSIITPSGYAYLQQGRHNAQYPNDILNLPDFILMRWEEVWHQI